MSNDLNQWSGIGRLGKDPETRYSAGGDAITSFSIACGWKSKDKEGTEWVNVTAFGKLAEICGEYLKKGKQVFIQGRLTTDKYEKDGVTRYSTKVIADRMQMLGGKDDGEERPQRARPQRVQQSAPSTDSGQGGFEDDDIPF
ncbi:single-stranded DNA-binding protein [Patescibacteria group bacterium]|nr:single-stranded DNA-binding protein [Patescibacteria group bacterium]